MDVVSLKNSFSLQSMTLETHVCVGCD